jgi:hypothetical protein
MGGLVDAGTGGMVDMAGFKTAVDSGLGVSDALAEQNSNLFTMGANGVTGGNDGFLTGLFDTAADAGGATSGQFASGLGQTIGQEAGAGFDWGSAKSALSLAQNGMSIYSGLKGMDQADQMRKLAAANAARADSWGASGGRALSDQQLQAFLKDPSQAAARDPAYALRIQGAQRANAVYGADSGAMSVAGANASTGWYDQHLQQMAGLAGASGTGAAGAQIGIQGQEYANNLESAGLASLGYGVTRMGANQNQLPANVMMFLQKMGYMQ